MTTTGAATDSAQTGGTVDRTDISVLVPYSNGRVAVVDLNQLLSNLEDQPYDEAVGNSAFDSGNNLDTLVERVRRANLGGDYWADVPGLRAAEQRGVDAGPQTGRANG